MRGSLKSFVLTTIVIISILVILFNLGVLFLCNNIDLRVEEESTVRYGKEFYDTSSASIWGIISMTKNIQRYGEVDTSKLGTYTLQYFCLGKTATRHVTVIDVEQPEIELLGDRQVYVNDINSYVEQGAKASDNVDGDITNKLVTELVQISKTHYLKKYSVTDSSGNVAETQRSIMVMRPVQKEYVGTICMTFDDGPSSLTPQYLDVLKEYGVKATFFILGFSDTDKEWKSEIVERALNEGHTIALHGASHEYSQIYSSVESATNNFRNENQQMKELFGVDIKIIRFPGGASNTISRNYCEGVMSESARILLEEGYNYFDWNVDSNDAGSDVGNSDLIFSNVVDGVRTGVVNVVLMHDSANHQATLDALPNIIEDLQSRGFDFEAISDNINPVRHGINN